MHAHFDEGSSDEFDICTKTTKYMTTGQPASWMIPLSGRPSSMSECRLHISAQYGAALDLKLAAIPSPFNRSKHTG